MKKKIKKLWVKALKSGKYKQGQEQLNYTVCDKNKETQHYCCLGVLCEVIIDNKLVNNVKKSATSGYAYNKRRDEHELPPGLRNRLDISEDIEETLINMNDGGTSFKQIAKFIEDTL